MSVFEIPENVRAAWPDGARDFDFLQGEWVIHHRRLAERLVGSSEWHEFETPFVMHPILGGLGNIDQCRTVDALFFEGVSLRLFDRADGLWRIYWIDSNGARLFPPVEGRFDGPEGVFRGEDRHAGEPVLVTFVWNRRDPERPTWQQAFSPDGGRSWETNWHMTFRRPDAVS
ncbi:MAG: hypothetical protein ABI592_08260 [Acidobacteriota bacterium]